MPAISDQKQIALLIPAHNEEKVLTDTIEGAIAAGVRKRDIFVVDDSSADQTFELAVKLLGKRQVHHVERAGKALALKQAIEHFNLVKKYQWVQIIDADSIFSPNYFTEISQHFQPGVAAVCGQVKSLQNNWITSYRALEYTIFQDFYKTLQNKFNVVGVMPGPATCLRADVIPQLDFSNDTLTEDFDITIQVHHAKLGRIIYAANAFSWTQDPPTLPIYIKQISRWYTGFFQVAKKHHFSHPRHPVDVMLLMQAADGFIYAIQLALLAVITFFSLRYIDIRAIFAFDFLMLLLLSTYAAIRMKRVDILTPMPTYYVLRLINVVVYVWSAAKVLLFSRFIGRGGMWDTTRIINNPASIKLAMKGGRST